MLVNFTWALKKKTSVQCWCTWSKANLVRGPILWRKFAFVTVVVWIIKALVCVHTVVVAEVNGILPVYINFTRSKDSKSLCISRYRTLNFYYLFAINTTCIFHVICGGQHTQWAQLLLLAMNSAHTCSPHWGSPNSGLIPLTHFWWRQHTCTLWFLHGTAKYGYWATLNRFHCSVGASQPCTSITLLNGLDRWVAE